MTRPAAGLGSPACPHRRPPHGRHRRRHQRPHHRQDAQRHGLPYNCFESSDRVGGNWAFGNPNGHSSAYRSLHIDTSKDLVSFRDFPMPETYPDFPHHTQIKAYLDDYADAFGLREHIEFENGVEHARRLPGGGWELETQAGETRHVDPLVVANGHHWDPRFPSFPGEFTGQTIHSHAYVDPQTPLDFHGKRILVVGIGNSAADITSELSSKALQNEVTLSTRSGAWIVPKYIAGKPADKYDATTPYLPLSWQRKFVQVMQPVSAGRPEDFGLPTPNHKFFEAHPTQSVELLLRLGSGDVTATGNVSRLDGSTVHFEDGTSKDFDAIVYATGYNITFPFFDEGFLSAPDNHLPLFKRVFKPGARGPRVRRLRPVHADAVPVRGVPGAAGGGVRRGALPAARAGGDGADHRRGRAEVPRPLQPHAAAHPAGRLLHLRARPAHQGAARRPPARARSHGAPALAVGSDEPHDEHPGPPATAEGRPAPRRPAGVAGPPPPGSSLDSINIADIARRAGVSRSAFYFYFESKADGRGRADGGDVRRGLRRRRPPRRDRGHTGQAHRDHAPRAVRTLDRHQHVFAAMLEARATSEAVRTMWDADRQSFVQPVAEMIQEERDGRPRPTDPTPSPSPPSCSSSTTACSSGSRSAAP